jgi:hypothetical protein
VRLIPREKKPGEKVIFCFADFENAFQTTLVINTLQVLFASLYLFVMFDFRDIGLIKMTFLVCNFLMPQQITSTLSEEEVTLPHLSSLPITMFKFDLQ